MLTKMVNLVSSSSGKKKLKKHPIMPRRISSYINTKEYMQRLYEGEKKKKNLQKRTHSRPLT